MILLLQGRRVVTAEEIAAHFEISVRTVYRDIAALGEAGVPIVAEAGVGYCLAKGYHMPPIMFTEQEAAALVIGAEVTEQVADESLKRSIGGALLKIRAVLSAEQQEYVSRLNRVLNIHFGGASPSGVDLMPIQEAVVRRRCLSLRYNAGRRGEITERVVEPLGMVFYARQWHLIAWCRLRGDLRDFRLDRLAGWTVLEEVFVGHTDFSMEEYLQREMACTEVTPVTLLVVPEVLDRFRADAPSKSVREESLPDGRVRIEMLSFVSEYLVRWLLSFGSRVEAEGPPELKEWLRMEAMAIAAKYTLAEK